MRWAIGGCLVAAALLYFASSAHAAALVAGAGVVGILATKTWGRVPVGVALAGVGVAVLLTGSWPGALLAVTGVYIALYGRGWRALGARYESPAARPRTEADVWDALDRGEDPTDTMPG